jgi:hypothetical protein
LFLQKKRWETKTRARVAIIGESALFGCFGIFFGSFLQGQNGREAAKRTPQPFYITLALTHTFRAEGQRNEPLGAFRLLSH